MQSRKISERSMVAIRTTMWSRKYEPSHPTSAIFSTETNESDVSTANRSTMSEEVTWNKVDSEKLLKTELFSSMNWFERISAVMELLCDKNATLSVRIYKEDDKKKKGKFHSID